MNPQPPASQPFLQEAFPELLSIKELADQVKLARDQSIAARLALPAIEATTQLVETAPITRTGGAFGGALKRRIGETDTATRYANTNDRDIYLLRPTSINREVLDTAGDLVYKGVLLTPQEMGAVTFSAAALTRRIGAKVLAHTTERPASARHNRTREVLRDTLLGRAQAATKVQTELAIDSDVFTTLRAKMKSPGYAHMKGYEMDALMAHAEGKFVDMIATVLVNHKLGTERVASLTAALDYLLGNDDYRKTFKYWGHMSSIGLNWTNRKIELFTNIQTMIAEEKQARP